MAFSSFVGMAMVGFEKKIISLSVALFVKESKTRRLAVIEFNKWASLEETMWRQKPREINTKFFHNMTKVQRRINFLSKVRVNGDF